MKYAYFAVTAALCACLCYGVVRVSRAAADALAAWGAAPEAALELAGQESREYRRAALIVAGAAIVAADFRTAEALMLADQTRQDLSRQVAHLRVDARDEISSLRADLRPVLAAGVHGIEELGRLRSDVKPVLASADELLQQSSSTVALIRPQALGLMAAAKVTAGETARAARRIDAALPAIVASVDLFARESAQTAVETRGTMRNLNETTRSLPRWVRLIPPLAQAGASGTGIAAAAGAFRR